MRSEYGTLQLGPTRLDSSGNFLLGMKEIWNLPHQVFYVGLLLAGLRALSQFTSKADGGTGRRDIDSLLFLSRHFPCTR